MTATDIIPEGSRGSRTQLIVQIVVVLVVLGVLVFGVSPAPFVVERPGPVYNTLGDTTDGDETVPIIDVEGAPTYPTTGSLDLLTVYLDGSRERPISWFDVLAANLDPTKAVLDIDAVYPDGRTADEASEQSAIDMEASQSNAVAAALTQLEIPYETRVVAMTIAEDTPASEVLEPGDELVSAEGMPIVEDSDLRAVVQQAGVGTPLTLDIVRDGEELSVEVTPVARSASDPSPMIGVLPGYRYVFPFDVEVRLQNVGGPSAGMMFALGIYDTLTPGELTGGERIAGTGTITPDGEVGPIGGIVQKMYGARSAGADWFLAPEANCSAVVGSVPDGLAVFAVDTLDEAVDVVEAIGAGQDLSAFATCES
ncbi:PDZ domain-containing protein [Salinibacterium sp. ZJ77]|uniref:YlbL family protein n=1 Tax=Salinibacterium sp. ZJ77 TaxID=2708337 RepID=UPI001FB9AA72|nr:PDZ domain-containing protein [Salinibacterium sp. ZJ77]